MAAANRIMVLTSTTGTADVVLPSTGVRDSVNGDCLAPAEVLGELGNRSASYVITSGGSFCYGTGLVSANGLLLTRDALEFSWNGSTYAQSKLSLAGTSTVLITPTESDFSSSSAGLSLAVARGAILT